MKVDHNTLQNSGSRRHEGLVIEKRKFTRICVEIDLRKTLISKFLLNNWEY